MILKFHWNLICKLVHLLVHVILIDFALHGYVAKDSWAVAHVNSSKITSSKSTRLTLAHVAKGLFFEKHDRFEGILLKVLMRLNLSNRASCCSNLVVHVLLRGKLVHHENLSGVSHVLEGLGDASHCLKSLFLDSNEAVTFASLHNGGRS